VKILKKLTFLREFNEIKEKKSFYFSSFLHNIAMHYFTCDETKHKLNKELLLFIKPNCISFVILLLLNLFLLKLYSLVIAENVCISAGK